MEGLTIFVKFPEVPIDNNEAERNIRAIAIQRKNFLGSHAEWSASFNAVILSLLQSAKINNLNPIAYLHYYLDACAEAGGVPSDLERFHPHTVSADDIEKYGVFS